MPRKAFQEDLKEAIQLTPSQGVLSNLKAGGDDGTFTFNYSAAADGGTDVTFEAIIPDVGDYPTAHRYMVFTSSENVPAEIARKLSEFELFDGLNVSQMLSKVAKVLDGVTAGSSSPPKRLSEDPMDIDSPMVNEHSTIGFEEDYDGEEPFDDDFDDEPSSIDYPQVARRGQPSRAGPAGNAEPAGYCARLRCDFLKVKQAGFHIGYLGDIKSFGRSCFVVMSIRISKLGVPEDAMQAWHLEPERYVMLLIHYAGGYKMLEDLRPASSDMQIRVGISDRQKISLKDAREAFSQMNEKDRQKSEAGGGQTAMEVRPQQDSNDSKSGLRGLFIGRPLDELLNGRLLHIIRYRMALDLPWDGAERYYNDKQGRDLTGDDADQSKYWAPEHSNFASHLPEIVTSDHLSIHPKEPSFPLLSMQYFLRHLVRCTDFCLVCHRRLHTQWEALMPYVCDNHLCLYQYMTLGFGPSIEYEIITQPFVVDLLVSFCYTSTISSALKQFPVGMGLVVPDPNLMGGNILLSQSVAYHRLPRARDGVTESVQSTNSSSKPRQKSKIYVASFDRQNDELIFEKDKQEKPLRVGDWICILPQNRKGEKEHRRVLNAWYPIVHLGPAVLTNSIDNSEPQSITGMNYALLSTPTPATTPPLQLHPQSAKPKFPQVEFIRYEQHFDELSEPEKLNAIHIILDTLPGVQEMKAYLQEMGDKHMYLRTWTDRMSPAAIGVLRWIVASNRSSLIQIDGIGDVKGRTKDRVSGMESYIQFKFAQGAPDKEQRFTKAVQETTDALVSSGDTTIAKYPTIFAWHGSPLRNWHGIIREGLHFNEVMHGRAYGNGVYFSTNYQTSSSYSNIHSSTPIGGNIGWQKSHLNISDAICLNEIVNAPDQFVSTSPHLVVKQIDWIQTRYLFVHCNESESTERPDCQVQYLEHDPKYTPVGPNNQVVKIPISAISKAGRSAVKGVKHGHKKVKLDSVDQLSEIVILSDDTDTDDRELLFSGDEKSTPKRKRFRSDEEAKPPVSSKLMGTIIGKMKEVHSTDFTRGTLDHSTLPLLSPPAYATPLATKALQREMKATLMAQDTHAAHELGWYLDPELVTNVYQWIVEFHSFEQHLPLAIDMKAKGIKSIVLELRFGAGFPYTPPFVRVIRPRFLPFMSGGGGHVTGGGALCMELLTNSGWNPASNIEAVLLQIRLAMSSTDPKPARLEKGPVQDYAVSEAVEAFRRACAAHGWEVSDDFKSISAGAQSVL